MSTTPSTSELTYTVVGEKRNRNRHGLTAIVLNRGGRQTRAEYVARLLENGAAHVITVLGPAPHYDIEQLAAKSTYARYLILSRESTTGTQINIATRETDTPYAIVLWSDMELGPVTPRQMEQVEALDALCVVPTLRSDSGVTVPSIIAPAFFRSKLRTVPMAPASTGALSLFPFGDVGLYDIKKFEQTGGFDETISNPYWQRMDFGFRAHLWGETIAALPAMRVSVPKEMPPDDTTPDASYARFYLKNLAVRFIRDQGRLSRLYWLRFLVGSGLSMGEATRTFREVRAWVGSNKYRFVQDATRVTELWEVEE